MLLVVLTVACNNGAYYKIVAVDVNDGEHRHLLEELTYLACSDSYILPLRRH